MASNRIYEFGSDQLDNDLLVYFLLSGYRIIPIDTCTFVMAIGKSQVCLYFFHMT